MNKFVWIEEEDHYYYYIDEYDGRVLAIAYPNCWTEKFDAYKVVWNVTLCELKFGLPNDNRQYYGIDNAKRAVEKFWEK